MRFPTDTDPKTSVSWKPWLFLRNCAPLPPFGLAHTLLSSMWTTQMSSRVSAPDVHVTPSPKPYSGRSLGFASYDTSPCGRFGWLPKTTTWLTFFLADISALYSNTFQWLIGSSSPTPLRGSQNLHHCYWLLCPRRQLHLAGTCQVQSKMQCWCP